MTDYEIIRTLYRVVVDDAYSSEDEKGEIFDFLSLVEAHLEEIYEEEVDL